jgi:hypothetical protein
MNVRTKLTLSSVYKFAYFPFSIQELAEALPGFGFTIVSPDNVGRQRFGGRLNLPTPLVAYRGPIEFNLTVSGQAISIRASDFRTAHDGLKEIEEFLLSELQFDSVHDAAYHQGHLQGSVAVESNPVSTWRHLSEQNELFLGIATVIGQPVQSYGIRLTSPGQNPNAYDWLDIRLEPDVQSAERQYMYDFLCRNTDQKSAFSLAKQAEEIVRRLVQFVEDRATL